MRSSVRLSAGAIRYYLKGDTPNYAHQGMIDLFCRTRGLSNDLLSRVVSLSYPLYRLPDTDGLLGNLSTVDLQRITSQLDLNGYHVFSKRVPDDLCDKLLEFATRSPCRIRAMTRQGQTRPARDVQNYQRKHPEGVRYDFSSQALINDEAVQGLMSDHSITAVAMSYLRCAPILDVLSMWWHTAYSQTPDSEAAQYWHFDMDRIKWLKFFVYLTDVTEDNGPHCFVVGSHRRKGIPDRLLSRGYARLTDEEVAQCYPSERLIKFVAPRGTIIAEDTRGLHKGKEVFTGDRLLLQLQFSNSLFGATYEPSRIERILNTQLSRMATAFPRLYSNYL